MSVLDRYIIRSLLVNYLIAMAVMVSLYVLLDMFVNMDEFTEQGLPLFTVLKNIGGYYGPQMFLYFAQLSGIITLFACTATLARLRRQNELTAILASGVSLYRVAAPVVGFGIVTTALLIVDTEWFIPRVAHQLARDHDDADGRRAYEVLFLADRENALLSAGRFHPLTQDMHHLLVVRRDEAGTLIDSLEADRAVWEASATAETPGQWKLERARQRSRTQEPGGGLGPQENLRESFPTVYRSDLGPEAIQLRQAEGWVRYLSLAQLRKLAATGTTDIAEIHRTRHARIAAPILGIVMLLLGLPFFLNRSPVDLVSDAGRCLAACGLCYLAAFLGQSVRFDVSSALPYWIPIFIFATWAMVLIDRIRT